MTRMLRLQSDTRGVAWWRLLLIATSTLILCSCRHLPHHGKHAEPAGAMHAQPTPHAAPLPGQLPPEAYTGSPAAEMSVPGPAFIGQWRPPGIPAPWPVDEYLFDGGDRRAKVVVQRDWTVAGLDPEDAVAHYDTLDGETVVVPSNRVPIYAPRFASVRQVAGIAQHENHQWSSDLERPEGVGQQDDLRIATTVLQRLQAERNLGLKSLDSFRDRQLGEGVDNAQVVASAKWQLLPYEDLEVVRTGRFSNTEKLRLVDSLQSALAWSGDQAVQVTLNNTVAVEVSSPEAAQDVHIYEAPPGNPRLRVLKLASRRTALPGEFVTFTIRVDNVGDETIGNVTIVDSLTTRLEYVEDSQRSSLEAEFFTQENEGESLVLRWEVAEPLEPGQGGMVRFRCQVR